MFLIWNIIISIDIVGKLLWLREEGSCFIDRLGTKHWSQCLRVVNNAVAFISPPSSFYQALFFYLFCSALIYFNSVSFHLFASGARNRSSSKATKIYSDGTSWHFFRILDVLFVFFWKRMFFLLIQANFIGRLDCLLLLLNCFQSCASTLDFTHPWSNLSESIYWLTLTDLPK